MPLKYKTTGETKVVSGVLLHRIQRVSDGLLGGFVESEDNLSQLGACYLFDNGQAYGGARIQEDAQVYGSVYDNAIVAGKALIKGQVFGSASVTESAELYGSAYESAVIRGHAKIYGEAFGNAEVDGAAMVYGRVSGNVHITGTEVVYGDKSN